MRHRTFSVIDILGFAFGISVCLLITLFLTKEYSFDLYNAKANQIYSLIDAQRNSSNVDYRAASAILNNYPEVKNVCTLGIMPGKIAATYINDTSDIRSAYDINNLMSTDNSFFRMFTTHFIYGDPSNPLPNPNSVVLTESSSQLLFGNEDPLGKEIVIMGQYPLTVAGVIKDFPGNSSINANIIVNMENNSFKFWFFTRNGVCTYFSNAYLQVAKTADSRKLVHAINGHPGLLGPYTKKVALVPLKDVHLYDNTDWLSAKRGNPALLELMMSIGLIVLTLAIINYVNLTMAQQNRRNKETGIRKTLGAGTQNVISLFLVESVFLTMTAFAVALVIVEITLPLFSDIVDTRLSMMPLMQFPGNILFLLSILIIGFLSGLGPALMLSSFTPVTTLSGRAGPVGKKTIRSLLTVFQFTVSIALMFCIIVIQKQISFAKNDNLGFDKEQLLRIDLPPIDQMRSLSLDEIRADISRGMLLGNMLKEYVGTKSASVTNGVPGNIRAYIGSGIEGKDQPVASVFADSNFIKTFGIKLVKGRNLLPGEYGKACVINEAAYKYFGWHDLTNKKFNGDNVIGVVKDFHTESLHEPVSPTCILFSPLFIPTNISLRIRKGTTGQTMSYLRKSWKRVFPNYPLDYQFYDEWFNQMYSKDQRFGEAIGMFGSLAITISCLGILGLAIFASERRAKEIGIRKVHGASVRDLMILLNKDFLKWIGVAFILACPIGWYAMNKWLQGFAYRTQISWWIFVVSGVGALIIAFLAVSWQTWRTATANPVESLRYE